MRVPVTQAADGIGRPEVVDRVILAYLLSITAFAVINMSRLPGWRLHVALNAAVAGACLLMAAIDARTRRPWAAFAHTFYPVVLLIWLYPQSGLLRHAVVGRDLDDVVSRWDLALFRLEWYRVLPPWLGVVSFEVLHALYFLYYASLGVFAMLAFSRQRRLVDVYLFALMTAMFAHMWVLMLFPASGPVGLRRELIPEGVVFIPIMNLIYASIDQGGGAFPSLHAAGAILATLFAGRFFPRWRPALLVFLAGILLATVACSFHYPIDTVAGILTGLACYRLLPKLYPGEVLVAGQEAVRAP